MKVNRQDSNEKNNITAPWLYEFAYDLEKGAYNNVDYLKDYFDGRKKDKSFKSIDEKMADIKERVGFNLARKISEEVNKDDKVTISEDSLKTVNIKNAEYKHSEKDIKLMDNIMRYVKDMVKHEPHLDRAIIIARCRDEDDLGFGRLRINLEKFYNWVDEQLEEASDKKDSELIYYIPSEPFGDSDTQDWEAEYYRHSKPES
jgi:hypothetical protein